MRGKRKLREKERKKRQVIRLEVSPSFAFSTLLMSHLFLCKFFPVSYRCFYFFPLSGPLNVLLSCHKPRISRWHFFSSPLSEGPILLLVSRLIQLSFFVVSLSLFLLHLLSLIFASEMHFFHLFTRMKFNIREHFHSYTRNIMCLSLNIFHLQSCSFSWRLHVCTEWHFTCREEKRPRQTGGKVRYQSSERKQGKENHNISITEWRNRRRNKNMHTVHKRSEKKKEKLSTLRWNSRSLFKLNLDITSDRE